MFFSRRAIRQLYGNWQNFRLSKHGWGWAFFIQSTRKSVDRFVNLNEKTLLIDNETYVNDSECHFEIFGMKAILYNKGYAQPIQISNIHGEGAENKATYWTNFAKLIKMYEQLKAMLNQNIIKMLIIIILLAVVIGIGATIYNLAITQKALETIVELNNKNLTILI
jgi:hypothetical protein